MDAPLEPTMPEAVLPMVMMPDWGPSVMEPAPSREPVPPPPSGVRVMALEVGATTVPSMPPAHPELAKKVLPG
jgi:hypothetical protein